MSKLITLSKELAKVKSDRQVKPPVRLSFKDFYKTIYPHLSYPSHLQPVIDVLNESVGDDRICISCPPQTGKSTLILAYLYWRMLQDQRSSYAYISYSISQAQILSKRIQTQVTSAIGHEMSGTTSHWQHGTNECLYTGIGGALTGNPVSKMLVVDDYCKNRAEAESAVKRQHVYDWFTSTAVTRVHPGASIIVVATRWNEDDLSGNLINNHDYKYINIPALQDGKSFWSRWPLDWLLKRKSEISDYDWQSLYLGAPLKRGGGVFHDCYHWTVLPGNLNIAIGIDLAYSSKKSSDYCVGCVVGTDGTNYYILDVFRGQMEVQAFGRWLSGACVRYETRNVRMVGSGQESEVIKTLNRDPNLNLNITFDRATQDKFSRALSFQPMWTAGKIQVPDDAPWLNTFITEVTGFDGISGHDDQVDAMMNGILALRNSLSPNDMTAWQDLYRHRVKTKGYYGL